MTLTASRAGRQDTNLESIILQSVHVQSVIQRLGKHGIPKETAEETASKFFHSIRSTHNPAAMFVSMQLSRLYLLLSFSNQVKYTGLEKVLEILEKGKVAVISNHASYGTVGDWFYFFSKNNIRQVYYGTGENVPRESLKLTLIGRPVSFVLSKILDLWIHNSGAIYLKRSVRGKSDALFHAVLAAYESHLLQNGAIVHNYTGRGRQKEGFVEQLNLSATPGILEGAEWIVPASVTYGTIPEAVAFSQALATEGKRQKKPRENKSQASSIMWALMHVVNWKKLLDWTDKGYGQVYINFGEPIAATHYAPNGIVTDEEKDFFHSDITSRIVKLVTMTPKSAIAVALRDTQVNDWFKLLAYADSLVQNAQKMGVHVSEDLQGGSYLALRDAFDYMAKKGAIRQTSHYTYLIKDLRLIDFYANTISVTLNSFAHSLKS